MSEPKDFEKLLREQVKATTYTVQESFDAVGVHMAQYVSLIQELSERMTRQDARIAEQDARIAEQNLRILELENPRSKYRSL
jgi:hypothetical protein